MKTLEDVQEDFCRAIMHRKFDEPSFIASTDPLDRLAIYKNTIFDTLRKALKITFPGIWILLGDECANNLAEAFCSTVANLPTSGCLDDWGSQFPDFIEQQLPLQQFAYLKDYGGYEWLKHLAYCADSAGPLMSNALEGISEEDTEGLSFSFLPSVFTLESGFALDEIVALIANPELPEIKSIFKKTYAIIARPNCEVLTFWVNADVWYFTTLLLNNQTLGAVYKAVIKQYPDFDLTKALQFLLQENLIANYR